MAHYYDSDDSTLYSRGSEQHRSRRRRSYSAERPRRPRRPRRRHSTTEEQQQGGSGSTAGTFVKLGLGVVLVQVVATCFSHWIKTKHETNEKEYREEKRRAFEKAKAKRRREEDEFEKRRQREEDDDGREGGREWDEREIIIREGRRLMPADAEDAVSVDTEVRRIEPAPDDYHDDGYSDEDSDWDDARRRAPSVAARSRSRFGRTKSVTGLRDGRSRSRPAERVP